MKRSVLSLCGGVSCGCLIALFFSALPAQADVITIGVVSFDNIVPAGNGPGTNGFTIYNFTGSNSQPGTPDSPLSFLSTSLLLNGTQTLNVGTVTPGSVQPLNLQFPTTTLFTSADFMATLNTTSFSVGGQNYVAASDQVTADLLPSSPPDLAAGTDFAVIDINASPVSASVPEPAPIWFTLPPLASLLWFRSRRRSC